MKANSSKKSGKQVNKPREGDDYPNIIEEPIRVVGDKPRNKPQAGKSQNKTHKRSGKK
jgi:hypothetical protein